MKLSLSLGILAAFAFASCEIDEPPPVRKPATRYPIQTQTQYPPQPEPFPQDPTIPPPPPPVTTTTGTADTAPPDDAALAPTAPAATVKADYPYAVPVPGKPGFVRSPYSPDKMTDVRGYAPGTEVKDPYTQKIFLVP
ncbi:MAG: hypothetical protein H0T11_00980 [Chthoniobacterales bacterium]|nr:hypothetical protein [Chthoniobacterales bacterium]